MTLTIKILKEDILHLVKTEAYTTGESIKDGTPVDIFRASKSQATNDDDYLLTKYIDSGVSDVIDMLSGHMTSAHVTTEDTTTDKGFDTVQYRFCLDLPATYDHNQDTALREGIIDYIAQYTLYKWYKRVLPDMADPTELDKIRSNIIHRVNQRVRPVRRPIRPLNF